MTLMARSSSHTRGHGKGHSVATGSLAPGKGGLGERAVSLPSLISGAGGGRGYPQIYDKPMKRTPSELLLQRREFGLVSEAGELPRPKITQFLDISKHSNQPSSVVPVDQPLFRVTPPVVTFLNFEGLHTYEATVTLRNQDQVARRVKIQMPDSSFFELAASRSPGQSRRISGGGPGDKVAPGMEVSYIVRFKPDAKIDYSYDLVVVTEREKFSVPIRASGGSALLDFPDVIDFGDDCVVGHKLERTVLVRNVGDRPSKFMLRTSPPFSVIAPEGYLAAGCATQVSVFFQPERSELYVCDMHLRYEELEACVELRGGATNVDVSLSKDVLIVDDTYVGLEAQGVVTIQNNSDVPVDFSWRLLSSVAEEREHRVALKSHLKQEESDEMLYLQQELSPANSDSDSGSDAERLQSRRAAKVTTMLSRKYGSINKAVREDPMLFRDSIFAIEPLSGRVWAHSEISCACTFAPKDALVYMCTAYLSSAGQEDRTPLVLKGLGIGPKATFSYDDLDVGNVFVDSIHRYEAQLLNQGDIAVEFRLVQPESTFGEMFKFTPDSGTIAVGGHCDVVVDFRPRELGEFAETFAWSLKGSASEVTITFRGISVLPSFEFDTEKINFGTVSFGFLNSRMLTLTNTSEVPCIYTLRIPGDQEVPNNEFEIIPAKGTLLPNCVQKVQVDFESRQEKKYDLKLVVDLENVGENLHEIPITAKCAIPTVCPEPHGTLNYGDIFIRYPSHQSLYLHNTSNLPAKFKVLPQDDKSRAEFEPDQWVGTVPPCASHVITVTLTAHTPGALRISMYVRIQGRSVPYPFVLVANSVGPRVLVDPPLLDWGHDVKCLDPVVRHVKVTNDSCIDATVRAFMSERKSLWSVHPKMMHLSPQETLQVAMTLRIDETVCVQDTLNLVVSEGSDLEVHVKGKGVGTPIKCEQDLEIINFGTLFTTHTEPRDVVLQNHGQQARRVSWVRDKDPKGSKKEPPKDEGKKKKNQPEVGGFKVEPENVILEPKSAYRFTFTALSAAPGTIEEAYTCNELVDKAPGPSKPIFKSCLKATFVAPHLKLSTNDIVFKFFYEKGVPVEIMSQPLTLHNIGPLAVKFRVEVPPPFHADVEDGTIQPSGSQSVNVGFDPGFGNNNKCAVVNKRLIIHYDDHPAVNYVALIGEVVFPNLDFDMTKLDFGTVLNETHKPLEVTMTNPTSLEVNYRWEFVMPDEDFSEPVALKTNSLSDSSRRPASGRGASMDQTGGTIIPSPATSVLGAFQRSNTNPPEVDLNQVFDILPIFGNLAPGESQTVKFTYFGVRNRGFKATATCIVEGGPEYEVQLMGNAATCRFSLDKDEIDFGSFPFTQCVEQEITLTNPSKVQTQYSFNLSNVSRPFVVEISPPAGVLRAEARERVTVRFRPGIPALVVETVLVEVGHFAPMKLTLRGNGTFPAIALALPRLNDAEHQENCKEAKQRMSERAAEEAELEARRAEKAEKEASSPGGRRRGSGGGSAGRGAGDSKTSSSRKGDERVEALPQFDGPSPVRSVSPNVLRQPVSLSTTQKIVVDKEKERAEMLQLVFEVDRRYLAGVLLEEEAKQFNSPPMSAKPKLGQLTDKGASVRRMRSPKRGGGELPPCPAAYYICDFGNITLGHPSQKEMDIFNCCEEAVMLAINARPLQEYGFFMEPLMGKNLQPGRSTRMCLGAARAKEEVEALVTFDWTVSVSRGPNYTIRLVANHVLPEITVSSEHIDFGRVVVGRKKSIVVELHNQKLVPVEWFLPEAKDKYGRKKPWKEVVVTVAPNLGTLQPGARTRVVVSFTPQVAGRYTEVLGIRLKDNFTKKQVQIVGHGDLLNVEVRPSTSYQLGPVMPKREGISQEITLFNPTDYAIEVYSMEFDKKYLEEAKILRQYNGYDGGVKDLPGFAEVPVRGPGEGVWRDVAMRVKELSQDGSSEAMDDIIGPAAPLDSLDESRYPYRVPQAARQNALFFGPPKSGISTLALCMADEDRRCVLTVDQVVEWALTDPHHLRLDRAMKKICDGIRGGATPGVQEVVHLFRRRIELADCNAGVIVDGLSSKYFAPHEAAEVVMEGFRGEQLRFLTVELPSHPAGTVGRKAYTTGSAAIAAASATAGSAAIAAATAGSAAISAASAAGAAATEASPAVKALAAHYEALQSVITKHAEELRARVAQLDSEHKAAAEEAAAAKKAADKAAAEAAAAAEAEASVSAATTTTDEAQAAVTSTASAAEVALAALTRAQGDLACCEASIGWRPPNKFQEEEPVMKPKPSIRKAKKGEEPPPPEPLPIDPGVEQAVAAFVENQMLVQILVEKWNAQARQEEQEKRVLELKKEARRNAKPKEEPKPRKANFTSTRSAAGTQPKPVVVEKRESVELVPSMEDWSPPLSSHYLPLAPPPYEMLFEAGRAELPLPLVPADAPLPAPSLIQVITPPPAPVEPVVSPNFKILTLVPVPVPVRSASKEAAKNEVPEGTTKGKKGKNAEKEKKESKDSVRSGVVAASAAEEAEKKEEWVSTRTRWILEPQCEQKLLLHFNSDEVAAHSTVLRFQVVDDVLCGPVPVNLTGIAAWPGISPDKTIIFPKRKKKRPQEGYATKCFITSLNTYDFGPLLVGRDPATRPQSAQPEGNGEERRTSTENGDEQADRFLMRHAETLKIYNDSLFTANVKLGLASIEKAIRDAEQAAAEAPPPKYGTKSKKQHEDPPPLKVDLPPTPYKIEPDFLQLAVGEQAEVKVWCFPQEKGIFEDSIVARIEDNPEPVSFGICALATLPEVSLDNSEVDFGRLMVNLRGDEQRVRLKNESLLPVRWQLLCYEGAAPAAKPPNQLQSKRPSAEEQAPPLTSIPVPEEFRIDPVRGELDPGKDIEVVMGFHATKAAHYKCFLRLEARDMQDFRPWSQAGTITATAETFEVDTLVEPDPRENILDFGTVLVNSTAERTFDIVNCGKFATRYELQVRRALREMLVIDTPKDDLPPGGRKTIKVLCSPQRAIDALLDNAGILLQIYDAVTGLPVEHGIPPLRVSATAVYNVFEVVPPRGLNFGPVERGEVQTRTFTIRNQGIFAFDWCLFDLADMPTVGSGGRPPTPLKDVKLQCGPFSVKPTSGKIEPDKDMQVEVSFEATTDKEYECKLALWVDGVQTEAHLAAEVPSRPLEGDRPSMLGTLSSIPGTSIYLVSGQSCVSGINTVDMQTIFEEQFVARTFEDAVAIAGHSDVRVFTEVDQIFNFGPVLAHSGPGVPDLPGGEEMTKGVTERIRLTNPKAIPCRVLLAIRPKDGEVKVETKKPAFGKKVEEDPLPFEVSPSEVVIPAKESKQIEVTFRPTRLSTFMATLEATVPAGSDASTNFMAFELRGDGAVPSVSLQGARLFGDDGNELRLGKLQVGRSHEVRMTLRNDGLLAATVRVESQPSAHFNVACPSSVILKRGEQRNFSISFHPLSEGDFRAALSIRTLGNPFEDYSGTRAIQLIGEGYNDPVGWDLTEVLRPGGPAARDSEPSNQAPLPPAPDDLRLGEVPIGKEVSVTFQLTNASKEPLRFEFPPAMPAPFGTQLQVTPSKGVLETNTRQTFSLTFLPTDPLEASTVPLVCKTVAVKFTDENPPPTGDPEAAAADRPFKEVPGTAKDVPLKVSATADRQLIDCDLDSIAFSKTVMFSTRTFRFTIRNPRLISAPFKWVVEGKHAAAFTVEPQCGSVLAKGEQEITVTFAPVEVEDFSSKLLCFGADEAAEPALQLPLTGLALRPWVHLELPPCDYKSRRQSDAPLDPKYHVAEITSLGTKVKNTKRFYVSNPTGETIDFMWVSETLPHGNPRPGTSDEDTFRCLTKRGAILPGKKFEMVFEFVPQTIETKESFWTFLLVSQKVEERFLIAGTVQEPRVGMNRPFINFGERLLEGTATETVQLVNKEHIPFSFTMDPMSFQPEGQLEALFIRPLSGVVGPDSHIDIEITFKPLEERPFNFNAVCNVKRKKDPVVLNVKGIGYAIHASLQLKELTGDRFLSAGTTDMLDFGMLQVHERRSVTMVLRNESKRNFNYRLQMLQGPKRRPKAITEFDKPPFIALSNVQGVAETQRETSIEVTYAPRDVHNLDGVVLQVLVPAGVQEDMFNLALTGGAKRSKVEFSFLSHDFGPCFCARGGATLAGEPVPTQEDQRYQRVDLVCRNLDDTDCTISTTFQREPWLDVQLHGAMIEAGASLVVPIIFSPREVCEYMQRLEFCVNDYTRTFVDIRGRGCALRLELTEIEMQNVDFGVATGGDVVTKNIKLVNRSPRPVTFELLDQQGEFAERFITWAPDKARTLRPRETCEVDLRFAPTHRVAAFRLPLHVRCDHGVESKLLQLSGTCHSMEMRLSEHSVVFGNVVVGSQATRAVRLHNYGDLGAKFRFEVPEKFSNLYSLSPAEGFVRPQEEIAVSVRFHPAADKVQQYKKTNRGAKGSKLAAASLDMPIATRDIHCILEGHSPLTLEVSGRCVARPPETNTLDFNAEVRTRVTNSFTIANPSEAEWKLKPQVSMVEPAGASYFSCPPEVTVPAGGRSTVEVAYLPLTMTGSPTQDQPTSPSSRVDKHRGQVFIGTPDGNALLYSLEGVALPPKANQRIEVKVPCKKQHTQRVPVKNWLQEKQRFDVKLDLVEPAPGSQAAQGISVQGVPTLDLPVGAEREYRFNIYAYHEGSALVRVQMTSQDTGEFVIVDVALSFTAAEKLATIKLEAACRQLARHKMAVSNPLSKPAKFKGSSSHPYVSFSQDVLEVPPKSEKTIDLVFRPLEEGSGEIEVLLKSDELGTYPYNVVWKATSAALERAMVLKAPLGGSSVERFRFMHYSKSAVTYSARIESQPGQKGSTRDFNLEAQDAKAPPCDASGEPVPVEFAIRYQPSALGDCHAMLVVSGVGGGEYKAMLNGFAQPPQPQGPIVIANGKQGTVEFRNPFDVPTEFSIQVDNTAFMVPQRLQKMDSGKVVQIMVSFRSDRVQNGRLIISSEAASTPWVFFLKGEL